jgi:uncharacterized protein YdeI (YjbR/CyaY-like superfamily)
VTSLPPNAVHPLTRAEWREWLSENHTRATGVWLVSYKKGTGKSRFDYNDSVEEALCFGWVDSKPNKLDEERTMLWFAPRKGKTGWSKPNKERVDRLVNSGLMQPAGMAKVDQAKADGSWSLLDAVEQLQVPQDLLEALAARPPAEQNFLNFPKSARRGILEWVLQARRPETRAARVQETARLAQLNQRANQWPGKGAA